MTKPAFESSPDVDACCEYLRQNRYRGLISYDALARVAKRDLAGKDRHILASARRKLEREGILFVTEKGKGIRLATAAQAARLSTEVPIIKTRRVVRTARKRQQAVNVQALSDEERAAFYIGRAVLGAIGHAASRAFTNRIAEESAKSPDGGVLPIKKTLEMFAKIRSRGSEKLQ